MSKKIALLICYAGILVSIVLPHLVSIVFMDIHFFVNAWDEETYLSFPVAEHLLHTPGYFSNYLNYVGHRLGIPGSYINSFYDIVILPMTGLLVFKILVIWGVEGSRAVFYTALILFSAVLFNHTNPIISYLFSYNHSELTTWLIPGRESYASLLRTPEPQFSYLVITGLFYLWSRYKQDWLLLLPIPFLYFFIAIAYSLIIASFLLNQYGFKNKTRPRFGAAFLISILSSVAICFVAFSVIYWGASSLIYGGEAEMSARFGHHYLQTRQFILPLSLVVLAPTSVYLILRLVNGHEIGKYGLWSIVFAVFILLMDNMQVISGFSLGSRQIQDRVISVLTGISLALFLESCVRQGLFKQPHSHFISLTCLLCITMLMSYSNAKWLSWQVLGSQISREDAQRVVEHPELAIIPNRNLAAKLPYAVANAPLTPFSYQQEFIPYDYQRVHDALLAARAHYGTESTQYAILSEVAGNILRVNPRESQQHRVDGVGDTNPPFFFVEPFRVIDQSPKWVKRLANQLGYL